MSLRTSWLTCLLLISPAVWASPPDPVSSGMWAFYHQRFLDNADYVHDPRIQVQVPPFAENARQVPLQIDARSLPGTVRKIMVWAELNPIPRILTFTPTSPSVLPLLAVRIRVEQATPIRAAVLLDDGIWHIGSARIEAYGGGCTAPSETRSQPDWEKRLGQVLGARFPRDGHDRLRLDISHPMDNGLSNGIPEFYLDQAQLRDGSGNLLAELELFPAVSENPNLTFEVSEAVGKTTLYLRDNNGNEFNAEL